MAKQRRCNCVNPVIVLRRSNRLTPSGVVSGWEPAVGRSREREHDQMTSPLSTIATPARGGAPAAGLTEPARDKENLPERAVKLVLVEDDQDFREAAAAELEDLGFEVE